MPLLPWSSKLEIGVASMDTQHQRWVQLINELHEAVAQRSNSDTVGRCLDGMMAYTQTHFADEETLLQAAGYPDYEAHKKAHEDFLRRLQHHKDRHAQAHSVLNIEVMMLLSGWLTHHIQEVDRQYSLFLKKQAL